MTAEKLRREQGLEIAVRIGINSGEVLTGTIGDRYNRYYTANGYAVGLAKRMEVLAIPNRIFLTEHTAALVAGAVAPPQPGGVRGQGGGPAGGRLRARGGTSSNGAHRRRSRGSPADGAATANAPA